MKEDAALSMNQAVIRIWQRVGVNPDTLRGWTKQARIDAGEAPGTTTGEAARIKLNRPRFRAALMWGAALG